MANNMKDLTPQQEAKRLYHRYFFQTRLDYFESKELATFTAQQIADNTEGVIKAYYLEVIEEIKKL